MAKRKSSEMQFAYDLTNVMPAHQNDNMFAGMYKTIGKVNLRKGAGAEWPIITVLPKGKELRCEGGYAVIRQQVWLFVRSGNVYGWCCKTYLNEVKQDEK